jgi:protoheme IX farnesyltransferase
VLHNAGAALLVLLVTMLNYKVSTLASAAPRPSGSPSGPFMITQTATHKPPSRISQYWALTKPRVTQLAVFCAVIGMFLATDGFPAGTC